MNNKAKIFYSHGNKYIWKWVGFIKHKNGGGISIDGKTKKQLFYEIDRYKKRNSHIDIEDIVRIDYETDGFTSEQAY